MCPFPPAARAAGPHPVGGVLFELVEDLVAYGLRHLGVWVGLALPAGDQLGDRQGRHRLCEACAKSKLFVRLAKGPRQGSEPRGTSQDIAVAVSSVRLAVAISVVGANALNATALSLLDVLRLRRRLRHRRRRSRRMESPSCTQREEGGPQKAVKSYCLTPDESRRTELKREPELMRRTAAVVIGDALKGVRDA